MKKVWLLFAISFFGFAKSQAQSVAQGTEWQELVKISEMYKNVPNLSFRVYATYADALNCESFIQVDSFTYKVKNGKSFLTNPATEMLFGGEYSVYVNKEDSVLLVSKNLTNRGAFQVPLMDSLFRSVHVDSVYINEYSSTSWIFNVIFKTGSPYSGYSMSYNPQTSQVSFINYYVTNTEGIYDIPTDHILCVNFIFDNYSDSEQDPAIFNENRYYYKLNGTLYPQSAWSLFQFINQ